MLNCAFTQVGFWMQEFYFVFLHYVISTYITYIFQYSSLQHWFHSAIFIPIKDIIYTLRLEALTRNFCAIRGLLLSPNLFSTNKL